MVNSLAMANSLDSVTSANWLSMSGVLRPDDPSVLQAAHNWFINIPKTDQREWSSTDVHQRSSNTSLDDSDDASAVHIPMVAGLQMSEKNIDEAVIAAARRLIQLTDRLSGPKCSEKIVDSSLDEDNKPEVSTSTMIRPKRYRPSPGMARYFRYGPYAKPVVPTATIGTQTLPVSIPKMPVRANTFPIPWGVNRGAKNAATQTQNALCEVIEEAIGQLLPESDDDSDEEDVIIEHTTSIHHGIDLDLEYERAVDEFKHMQPYSHTPKGYECISSSSEDDDGDDSDGELVFEQTCIYEGWVTAGLVIRGRRTASTNTSHVPLRRIKRKQRRYKSWAKAARESQRKIVTADAAC